MRTWRITYRVDGKMITVHKSLKDITDFILPSGAQFIIAVEL